MRRIARAGAIVLATAIAGCAVHPLPNDVTGLSTNIIVRQIRCETREAVIDSILGFLTNDANFHSAGRQKVDAPSRAVGLSFSDEYARDRLSISRFHPRLLTGFARQAIGTLWNTGIAYNYDLEMTEINNVDPEINLLRTFPMSVLNLGIKGNFDRQRQNIRTFTITDNFGTLVHDLPATYCPDRFLVGPNMIYPVAGQVGMRKVVQDFLVLALFDNLAGDGKDVTAVKGPPTMVDQLDFETTIGGSVTPKITFTPLNRGWEVADATLGLSASRKDVHKLTVGLYLATPGDRDIGAIRAGIFQQFIAARGNAAEKGAAIAVDQFLQQKALQPKIVIQQP
jgi:hypothetical protein